MLLLITLALALIIGMITALGGFDLRNPLRERQRGEVLDIGPVNVTLIRAYHFEYEQLVEVHATCELTLDSSSLNLNNNVAEATIGFFRPSPDPDDFVFAESNSLSLGYTARNYDTDREEFAPDVPPIPCIFRFDMPDGSPRPQTFRVVIYELDFVEDTNVKNDEDTSKTWRPQVEGYWVELPVEWAYPRN